LLVHYILNDSVGNDNCVPDMQTNTYASVEDLFAECTHLALSILKILTLCLILSGAYNTL